MPNENEFIKIAVHVDNVSTLQKIHKTHTLQRIIDDVCKENGKNNENQIYGLQITYALDDKHLVKKYVTERNLENIKDGYIVKLVPSIQRMLRWIFGSCSEEITSERIKHLPELCNDITVIQEMKECNYLDLIPRNVMKAKGEDLEVYLMSLNNILLNNVTPSLDLVLRSLVHFVKSNETSAQIVKISLQILNQIVNCSNYRLIRSGLKIDDITPYFWQDDDHVMQLHTLTLLNNFVKYSNNDRDKVVEEIISKKNKTMIYENLFNNAKRNRDIARQLFLYQVLILNSSYNALLQPQVNFMDDFDLMKNTLLLNRKPSMIDFEEKEFRSRKNTCSSDSVSNISRLSRASSINDQVDNVSLRSKDSVFYSSSPVEMIQLTASCIDYFKKKYEKNFTMSVLEAQYYPGFYKICDEIVHILCDILQIGKEPDVNKMILIPLVFTCNEFMPFFEELFCRALWLLARTRREIKARVDEDHQKVLAVVKEQIITALNNYPLKLSDITENFKKITPKQVYATWEKERTEKWKHMLTNTPSILQLKIKLQPQVMELIREQRLRVLKKGDYFPKLPEKKGKQLYWFIYLSQNNRILQYGDYDIETGKFTSSKIDIVVANIEHVVTGKASRHVKDNRVRRNELISRCFSLLFNDDKDSALDFLAVDNKTADYWIDGFHLLLGKPAESKSYQAEKEILLNMDLNLELIELQNISLPQTAPVVPPLPPEYRPKPSVPPKSSHLRLSLAAKRSMIQVEKNDNASE